jgi:hypothetical protein
MEDLVARALATVPPVSTGFSISDLIPFGIVLLVAVALIVGLPMLSRACYTHWQKIEWQDKVDRENDTLRLLQQTASGLEMDIAKNSHSLYNCTLRKETRERLHKAVQVALENYKEARKSEVSQAVLEDHYGHLKGAWDSCFVSKLRKEEIPSKAIPDCDLLTLCSPQMIEGEKLQLARLAKQNSLEKQIEDAHKEIGKLEGLIKSAPSLSTQVCWVCNLLAGKPFFV